MLAVHHRMGAVGALSLIALCIPCPAPAGPGDAASPGGRLYAAHCAACHDKPAGAAPATANLESRSADSLVAALTIGGMRTQAAGMTALEVASVATYLTGQSPGRPIPETPEKNSCETPGGPVAVGTAQWNGWGRDLDNSRYQPEPAIRAADVPRLAVKWAFGYHSSVVYGQPSIVDGRLFVGSSAGRVYSLDARTGCTYWTFDAAAAADTAIAVGEFAPARAVYASKRARRRERNAHIDISKPPSAVFFGDEAGTVYALDAQRGTLLWKAPADTDPSARISGTPVPYHNRLYVPVSSNREPLPPERGAGCCTFRGSVVAMDLSTGRILWKRYMVAEEGQPAPDGGGGGVGASPTIDVKRGLLYAASGGSYSGAEMAGADAIVALDLEDGRPRWVKQLARPERPGPAGAGDIGAPVLGAPVLGAPVLGAPVLRALPNGRRVLLAERQPGVVLGLDPDLGGEIVWQARVGEGEADGGLAADHRNVYVATAAAGNEGAAGLTALDMRTGNPRWRAPVPAPVCSWGVRNCIRAQPQAITVMPGIAFAGALDGHLRAYSTIDGKIVWDFDTGREFPTVNGVHAAGGSLDRGGPTIVNGMLYVNSGYGRSVGQPGNLLLAFSVGGR
jgi:polyvinyl alcohol dehydrogenase (cytochrome)